VKYFCYLTQNENIVLESMFQVQTDVMQTGPIKLSVRKGVFTNNL